MSGVSCAAVVMFIVRRVIATKTYHRQYMQVKDGIPLGPYMEKILRVIPLYFCV